MAHRGGRCDGVGLHAGVFIAILDVQTLDAGLSLALRVWIGFVAAVMSSILLWGKHFRVYLIDAGNQCVIYGDGGDSVAMAVVPAAVSRGAVYNTPRTQIIV
jgi:hypothetical protein